METTPRDPSDLEPVLELGAAKPRKPDDDLVSYLSAISGSIDSGITDGERAVLLENFFEEVLRKEASLASIKRTSFTIEKFIKLLGNDSILECMTLPKTVSILKSILENTAKYFGWLCYNRFSSHVLESLFRTIQLILYHDNDSELSADCIKDLETAVLFLADEIIDKEEWQNLIYDTCGTHVLRSLFDILRNEKPAPRSKKSKKGKKQNKMLQVLKGVEAINRKKAKLRFPEFDKMLNKYLVCFSRMDSKQMESMVTDPNSSPVLQIILTATSDYVRNPKKNNSRAWNTLASKIIDLEADKDTVQPLFKLIAAGTVSSHCLEVLILSCSNEYYTKLLKTCMAGIIADLSQGGSSNFVIQNSILRVSNLEEFDMFYNELNTLMKTTLIGGNLGVIWSMFYKLDSLSTSIDCSIQQKRLIASLEAGIIASYKDQIEAGVSVLEVLLFHCKETVHTPENKEDDGSTELVVSILGCMICKLVFKIGTVIISKLAKELIALSKERLKALWSDPVGGKEVIESIFDEDIMDPEVKRLRKNLTKRVMEYELVDVFALDRFGWHGLRKCFDCARIGYKTKLVKILSDNKTKIISTSSGMSLLKHTKVQLFSVSRSQWNQLFNDEKRKRGMEHDKIKTKRARIHKFLGDMEITPSDLAV